MLLSMGRTSADGLLTRRHSVRRMSTDAASASPSGRVRLEKANNFMRQFRDAESRQLKKLTANQFMEVWSHYDADGEWKTATFLARQTSPAKRSRYWQPGFLLISYDTPHLISHDYCSKRWTRKSLFMLQIERKDTVKIPLVLQRLALWIYQGFSVGIYDYLLCNWDTCRGLGVGIQNCTWRHILIAQVIVSMKWDS